MIKQVDLIAYLPLFMQEYNEVQKIAIAENPEFQLVWDINEQLRNNLYILTATESGLKRFEKILGVYPSAKDTIESRRLQILSRWNEQLPYTIWTLKQQLESVCGKDTFTVKVENDQYILRIRLINLSNSIYLLVYVMLTRIVPSNMVIDLVAEHRLTADYVYVSSQQSTPIYKTVIDGDLYYTNNAETEINIVPRASPGIRKTVISGELDFTGQLSEQINVMPRTSSQIRKTVISGTLEYTSETRTNVNTHPAINLYKRTII